MLRTVYKSHSNQRTNHTIWITSSPDSKSKMQPCPHFTGMSNSSLLKITKQRDQEDHLSPHPLSQRHHHTFCISRPQDRRLFHPLLLQICFLFISETAPQEQRPHKTKHLLYKAHWSSCAPAQWHRLAQHHSCGARFFLYFFTNAEICRKRVADATTAIVRWVAAVKHVTKNHNKKWACDGVHWATVCTYEHVSFYAESSVWETVKNCTADFPYSVPLLTIIAIVVSSETKPVIINVSQALAGVRTANLCVFWVL